ncbi:hypothetical protein V8C44DRAFT_134056 [Trichoderma aethiopicum]
MGLATMCYFFWVSCLYCFFSLTLSTKWPLSRQHCRRKLAETILRLFHPLFSQRQHMGIATIYCLMANEGFRIDQSVFEIPGTEYLVLHMLPANSITMTNSAEYIALHSTGKRWREDGKGRHCEGRCWEVI